MKVSLVQLNSVSDIDKNFNKFLYYLKLSKTKQADLIIFPENTFFIGEINNYEHVAQKINDIYLPKIQEEIKQVGIDVILGGLPFLTDEGIKNRLLYINGEGNIITHYDKIHLFKLDDSNSSLNEASYLSRGETLKTIEKKEFNLGLSICYDLRFPELYRGLIDKGANVLVVPSAFTHKTGSLHWLELLKARAIENQSYVLGINQVGKHESFGESYGCTAIVKPSGETISLNTKSENILVHDLNMKEIDAFRAWIPALKNRVKFE